MIRLRERLWRTLCLLIPMAAAVIGVCAQSVALPNGWRLPDAEELSDLWRTKNAAKYAIAVGDFDGDGRPDRAMLLISDRRGSFGLFVFLARSTHGSAWRKIDEVFDASAIHGIGIEIVAPGKYKTACGKAYIACKRAEPERIQSANPVINYFKVESANRYVYFDRRSKVFKKVWMSD